MQTTLIEQLYTGYGQSFEVTEQLFTLDTGFQRLEIFTNPLLGRVMTLDGVVQTTEKDEFVYHEMLTHVPLLAHPLPKRVLIIGGGDGGILREVMKHPCVEQVTMVEIDAAVIETAKQYFPAHSAGAFGDARLQLVIGDGVAFVNETNEQFDVVISDSTDPYGPAEALFSADFYTAIRRCLAEQGVFVAQNGVPFYQLDELLDTAKRFKPLFVDSHFFTAAVPTYVGGVMTLAWGATDRGLRHTSIEQLQERYAERGLSTRYYTPEMHVASFALPKYVEQAIAAVV
ncbi:MAG: polyamine aminopropyltransferase [Gammaproteobacteria bacterium]|nr:polyamine aminopropyltransferase [Gammaproteobacteria bacterium]